jgi:cytochrome c peroxidase
LEEEVMNPARFIRTCTTLWIAATALAIPSRLPAGQNAPNMAAFDNPSGQVRSFNVHGAIDFDDLFFQSIGTNGRACASCHQASDAWSVTPAHIQARFDATNGEDPIFRTNDGSTSPFADVSTLAARRTAYSMLLTKGLIRVGIGLPAVREFELVDVDDPYGYASASELSLFRRPLPSTNLGFLATVMWDGRETFAGQSLHFDLSDQSNAATLTHAAGANSLTDAERQEIVKFEMGLFTAQAMDNAAGNLGAQGAGGGPVALSTKPFFVGINDVLTPGFNPRVFTMFDAWLNLRSSDRDPYTAARTAIARGQEIFNTRPITISGVKGVNDVLGVPSFQGTCTTCHDTPGAGDHSVSLPLDLGLTDESRRTPDMPLYTFRNNVTGELLKTTDPGRGLITGKWKQLSLFKGPILRGLSARAPYFHNGFAATLADAVDFYNTRFNLQLTAQERADLIAFLHAL